MILTLAAGLLAGLAAWLGWRPHVIDVIKPPRHSVNSKGIVLNVTNRREVAAVNARNAGLVFSLLGASLAAGLGAAGGLSLIDPRAVRASLMGLAIGAAGGATISLAVLPLYNDYQARHPDEAARDLILPLLVHAGIWSGVAAAAGLVYGLGLGERKMMPRIVLGGLIGALLGTVAYELVGAVAFPAAQTTQFVSATWTTQDCCPPRRHHPRRRRCGSLRR